MAAMLDCTAQQTSHGRIPASLLTVYVQYKQDTRAIVAWLVSHGPSKYKRPQTLYIKDLLDLADTVQKKAVKMPEIIAFHFREAIAARTYMTKFFRRLSTPGSDDQENINHEHFTTCLTEIYASLCECCGQLRQDCKRGKESGPPGNGLQPSNRFSSLQISGSRPDRSSTDEVHRCRPPRDGGDSPLHSTCPRLVDDTLGESVELLKETEVTCQLPIVYILRLIKGRMQEMNDLLAATRDVWQQVANGEVPLVVGAFISNAAFAVFEEIEQRLKATSNIWNPAILREKFVRATQVLVSPGSDDGGPSFAALQLVESLDRCWRALLQLKSDGPSKHSLEEKRTVPAPSHLIIRQGPGSKALDDNCQSVLLHSIAQHIQTSAVRTSMIYLGSPVFPEVGYYLTHPNHDDDNNSLRCSYGLHFLLSTYKDYLFARQPTPAPSSCRLQALQFAQDAIPSIRAVLDDVTMPCRCPGTLAYHLENLHQDFTAFLQARMFDFYSQSPWVCGSQILEMLDALFYYGLRLFSYRNLVGSVVHIYNVLRQFTDMDSIPLLDHLCSSFGEILFPGGRPCRRFKACYVRYMGGRLHFHSRSSAHKSGCHSMAVPAHAARVAAGFGTRKEAVKDPRFDSRKISLLYHIKGTGYHVDSPTRKRVRGLSDEGEKSSKPKAAKAQSCSHPSHGDHHPSSPCSRHQHLLSSLQKEVVQAEFRGAFPVARVNLFQVYLSCIRIVSTMSDQYHGESARPGQYCLCSADALLAAADRCRDDENPLQPLGCTELVRICRNAICEALKGETVEQFLWGHV
ncbi:MAG: hypothetical protein Q9163_004889 [Psora crenata]